MKGSQADDLHWATAGIHILYDDASFTYELGKTAAEIILLTITSQ